MRVIERKEAHYVPSPKRQTLQNSIHKKYLNLQIVLCSSSKGTMYVHSFHDQALDEHRENIFKIVADPLFAAAKFRTMEELKNLNRKARRKES